MVGREEFTLHIPVCSVFDDVWPQSRQKVGLVHLFDESSAGSERRREGVEHVVKFVQRHCAQLVDGESVGHVEEVEVEFVGVHFKVAQVGVNGQGTLVQPLDEDLEQTRLLFREGHLVFVCFFVRTEEGTGKEVGAGTEERFVAVCWFHLLSHKYLHTVFSSVDLRRLQVRRGVGPHDGESGKKEKKRLRRLDLGAAADRDEEEKQDSARCIALHCGARRGIMETDHQE